MNAEPAGSPKATWIPMIVLAGVMMAGLGHAGCGSKGSGSGGGAAGNEPVHITAIYLNSNLIINLQVGSSITLTAIGGYSDGGTQPEAVTYSLVPAAGVASLVGNVLTGVAPGQATLTATSVAAPSVTKSVVVNVMAAPVTLSISTTIMNTGEQNVGYPTQQLIKSGGLDPVVWSVISGALPGGLTLSSSTGVVSGTPVAQGLFNFTVKVRDSANSTATKALSITILAPSPTGTP